MEWGRFELADHIFISYLEETVFRIKVLHNDVIVVDRTIPLMHEPRFGPDVEDVAAVNEMVEKIIVELNLEDR